MKALKSSGVLVFLHAVAVSSGVIASLVMGLGFLIAMAYYNESNAGPYSPFNHLVSELGWRRVSSGAWIYNGSIFLAGILSLPVIHQLGDYLGSRLGRVAAFIGKITSLIGSSLGLVSMDWLWAHIGLAGLYFWGTFGMSALFCIAIRRSGRRGQMGAVFYTSLLLCVLCAVFVVVQAGSLKGTLKMIYMVDRPRFWYVAVSEWAVLCGCGLWLLSANIWLLRRVNRAGGTLQ